MNKIVTFDPIPHILIPDMFGEKTLEDIRAETDYLYYQARHQIDEAVRPGINYDRKKQEPEYPLMDGRASRPDGRPMTRKTSLFVGEVLKDQRQSIICREMVRFFMSHAHEMDTCWLDKAFMRSIVRDRFSCLVNFYEAGDFYLEHVDESCTTLIICLQPQGPVYQDGEMTFEKQTHELNLQHNSAVIFPSSVLHGVREIKSLIPGPVRITLTFFLY